MKLYHGSLEIVKEPEIRKSNRTLDYGTGFYATTSIEQAESWVKRRMKESRTNHGYINEYELDKEKIKELQFLSFEQPTEEWVDFVMSNRIQLNYEHHYDLVYGPVANDRVYASFALYESGIIDRRLLISELKTYKLVDQFLFHTEASLKCLTFIIAKEVTL